MLLASEDKGIESNLTMYDENILSFAGLGNLQQPIRTETTNELQ